MAPDGVLRGPELPEGFDWPTQTRVWWQHQRENPVAQTFEALDWDFLLDTALLHAAFWNGKLGVADELRQRVAKFGATPEERRRLRVEIAPPTPAQPQTAAQKRTASARDPRARLKVVSDGSAS